MDMHGRPRFRFQYSLRTLFVVTAIVALLLVPVVWVARDRQRVLEAREAALRAVVLAERDRTLAVEARYRAAIRASASLAPPPVEESANASARKLSAKTAGQADEVPDARPAVVEQLLRDNAALKQMVVQLQREIERLKAMTER